MGVVRHRGPTRASSTRIYGEKGSEKIAARAQGRAQAPAGAVPRRRAASVAAPRHSTRPAGVPGGTDSLPHRQAYACLRPHAVDLGGQERVAGGNRGYGHGEPIQSVERPARRCCRSSASFTEDLQAGRRDASAAVRGASPAAGRRVLNNSFTSGCCRSLRGGIILSTLAGMPRGPVMAQEGESHEMQGEEFQRGRQPGFCRAALAALLIPAAAWAQARAASSTAR